MDSGINDKDLSSRIARLSPAKRALLELKLRPSGTQHILHRTIPRRPTRDSAPLSFAQQRLWFLNQLEPESAAYNEATAFRLQGDLDVDALSQALNTIVERHEVLRTTIELDSCDNPIQVVSKSRCVDLPILDLQGKPESDVRQAIVQVRNQPFNLSGDLMLRVTLLKTGVAEHILIVIRHHIASDGWSSGVFFSELAALYHASAKGQPNPLSPLPIQYADYAVWQRQQLQGEVLERQVSFWREYLRDLPALELPTDRPRPSMQTHRGARKSLVLPRSLAERLTALSRRENATLFMTFLAAFQILLHRYSGQDDIAVGSPITGRTRMETEGLIGFFVNTLVFRTELSGNPTFQELLARVRQSALQVYEHQDLPFEKLVEVLNPNRDRSRNALVQVMFALQNIPRRGEDLPGLVVTPVELESNTAKFDLSAAFIERAEKQALCIEYNTDLFDAETIERMLGHFQTLLQAIASKPESRLSELPILTEAEQRQILIEWNDTKSEYQTDRCIHELFERQVERTPEAIAVEFEGQRVTYGELNCRANQLAHYLRTLDVGPEVLVGICLERSVELVTGILGVLKAGGAYVPLDPSHPAERQELMLDDARVSVLLSHRSLEDAAGRPDHGDRRSFHLGRPIKRICLDSDWDLIASGSDTNPENSATADNLAYVIYTSGSTGQPKGVKITHASLLNLVSWHHQAFSITASDRATQLAGPGFDAAVWELWPYLTIGASIHIPNEVTRFDSASLQKWLISRAITIGFVPAALVESLVILDWPQQTRLRILLTGGDTLNAYPPEQLPFKVFNNYGPTEYTVVATSGEIVSSRYGADRPTIGRPISNTQIYILDGQLQPVPIGLAGELHIGGAGLAREYLNRADLTAEKFISNPFSTEPGARLYKTGDLARYLPSGSIEFLGRIDDQINIRGYRIEPGEIEAVLIQHPAVQQVVVLASGDSLADKRLIAYVVAAAGFNPSAGELRAEIQQRLPEYMVPSNFVFLQALPVNRNGKLDRTALPLPDQKSRPLDQEFVAPRTPIEEILANIWGDLLKLDRIGVHDNFFQLGGHSLLATQSIARINAACAIALPLARFFETPTIAGLAAWIENLTIQSGTNGNQPIAIRSGQDAPLSFAQQRLWFLDQLEPGKSIYNIPGALRLKGALDVDALQQSLERIVRRHEALRTTFATTEAGAVQVISPTSQLTLLREEIRCGTEEETEAEISNRVALEGSQPFDLSRGPLLRAKLICVGADDHVLLLTIHHIVSDGWSMSILYRELAALYRAFLKGEASPLAELPIQYADFALWQREWLKGPALDRQLAYWKKQLDGIPPLLNLPTDRPRPAIQSFRGKTQSPVFGKDLVEALKAFSRKEGVTLFMTLLAAFQTLLYRHTGQEDIVVGAAIANRNRTEVEGLIGFFVNALALRANFSGDPTFREFLASVRRTALEAYEHQDLPFEKLVEEINPHRSLSYTPIFQVMFVLQNAPDSAMKLEDLSVSRVRGGSENAKFDLTLSISEIAEGLRVSLQYNTDLFEDATIERCLGHFEVLLRGIVHDPTTQISELPLMTEAESRDLIKRGRMKTRYEKASCLHDLFEEQARRAPQAVALIFEEQHWTYGELDACASVLACTLRGHGVGSDVLVGLCTERSPELIIGILAILKAGGAYLPLDPSYPKQRIEFMLEDSEVSVIITQKHLVAQLPAGRFSTLFIDGHELKKASPASGDAEFAGTATPDSLAYVIYTSGSTGKPKGTLITHYNVVRLFQSTENWFHFTSLDVWALFHSYAFDFSVWEIWGALLHGGKLVIVPGAVSRASDEFAQLIETHRVTVLNQTPSAFRQLMPYLVSSAKQTSLRYLIFGGEALDPEHLRPWFERYDDHPVKVINMYGTTETTVHVTYRRINLSDLDPRVGSVIGTPLPDLQAYVLDARRQVQPVGTVGELYIGGAGVAIGYHKRLELTAERFLADPFDGSGETTLYKTGDLARWLSNGELEYFRRADDQVKVRGYRIELGEIEAVLGQHPAVREAVVLAREDNRPGDQRLVAYIVTTCNSAPSTNELRSFLQQKLPEYMMPSVYMFLEVMPLTLNGKVDRKALPIPQGARPELDEAFSEPRTPTEEVLLSIWLEVLKLDKVGIHDNFFKLGGYSLLATQVVSRIREMLLIDLPLRALFAMPTIAGLSAHIEAQRCAKHEDQRASCPTPNQREKIVL